MKKTITLILSALIIATQLISVKTARADQSEYYRIVDSETPFFSDNLGQNLLFYLPYTYYVKMLENGGEFSHVECYGEGNTALIDGYVPSEKLFCDGLKTTSPYLSLDIKTLTNTVLYTDATLSTPIQYVFSGRNLKYFGEMPLNGGTKCFFVSYNDKLGYVKESDVEPFEVENHPNELTFLEQDIDSSTPPPTVQNENGESNAQNELRIVIIACLIIAGFIAIAISFRNKPNNKTSLDYYEETDCE